jgi:hypothetical protein
MEAKHPRSRQTCPEGFCATFIHPFQDSQGNLGEDVTYFDIPVGSTGTLIEHDAGGAHSMGARAEADRAYGPSGQQFAYDVTYASLVAVEYTNGSATALGTGIGF